MITKQGSSLIITLYFLKSILDEYTLYLLFKFLKSVIALGCFSVSFKKYSQIKWNTVCNFCHPLVDGGTYAQLLGLSEFLTMDKAGALATAQTGQIGFIDGIPVFITAEMPLTMSDGKVNTASGTNDRGTALCVYRPGWFVGYRRRIAVNVDYIPYYDSYQMTATVRLAFANFDNDVASTLFNIAL